MESLDNSNGVQYYGGNDPAKMSGRIRSGGVILGKDGKLNKTQQRSLQLQASRLEPQVSSRIKEIREGKVSKDSLSSHIAGTKKIQSRLSAIEQTLESSRKAK